MTTAATRSYKALCDPLRAEAQAKPAAVTATAVACPACGKAPGNPCLGYRGGNEAHAERLALRSVVRAFLRALPQAPAADAAPAPAPAATKTVTLWVKVDLTMAAAEPVDDTLRCDVAAWLDLVMGSRPTERKLGNATVFTAAGLARDIASAEVVQGARTTEDRSDAAARRLASAVREFLSEVK